MFERRPSGSDIVESLAIGLVLLGTPFGVLFGSFVVLPSFYESHPNLVLFLYALLFYGYASVTALWLLLRLTNTEVPPRQRRSDDDDDQGDGGGDTTKAYDPFDLAAQLPDCSRCHRPYTARSHHCGRCDVCIAVQDHHCFFAGRCIGERNQKYFLLFTLWYSFGMTVSTIVYVVYLYQRWDELDLRWFDMFPTASVLPLFTRFVLGYIGFESLCLVGLYYTSCAVTLGAVLFFGAQLYQVSHDLTFFELRYKPRRPPSDKDDHPMSAFERIRACLGEDCWLRDVLAPALILCRRDKPALYAWRRLFY